jgi:peroxiredoxin
MSWPEAAGYTACRRKRYMSGYRLLLGPAVALALIVAISAVSVCATVGVGQKAPDFTIDRIGGSGNLNLASTQGKATVLVFWYTACPHCTRELPVLQRLYSELKDKGLVVVGVSVDRDAKDAASYMSRNKITFPMGYGGRSNVSSTYGVQGVPMSFVIDDKGIVRFVHLGEVDAGALKSELSGLGVK